MLAEFTTDHLVAIVVAMIVAAVPATIGAVSSIRARRDSRPRNGKTLGETIHDSAQTVEIVQAQQHAIVGEFEQVHGRLGRIEEKVDRVDGRVDRVDTKLDKHLTDVGEGSGKLADWARRKMQEEEP
jgi:peptidoglycan hydrolase CwlO-like protein